MELVQVDGVRAQRVQRVLKLLAHLVRRPDLIALETPIEAVAELGGDDPVLPVVADGTPDHLFREVIAVAFRRVDQVDAQIVRAAQNAVRFGLGEVFTPLAAELPCTDADHRDAQSRLPKLTEFHTDSSII